MKKKTFFKPPILLTVIAATVLCMGGIVGNASWSNTISNNSWSTIRYLYDVRLVYLNESVVTYSGLERNSQIDILSIQDMYYTYSWRLEGSNTDYTGVQSIDSLYNADSHKTTSTSNGVTTTTITLYQTYVGISEGYFKVEVNSGINTKSNNAPLTLNYSYVTPLIDNFNLFNVNPTYEGLTLDHFTIGGSTYSLNDVLHLKSGGAHASLLSNSTLTLVAYFK